MSVLLIHGTSEPRVLLVPRGILPGVEDEWRPSDRWGCLPVHPMTASPGGLAAVSACSRSLVLPTLPWPLPLPCPVSVPSSHFLCDGVSLSFSLAAPPGVSHSRFSPQASKEEPHELATGASCLLFLMLPWAGCASQQPLPRLCFQRGKQLLA